MQTNLPTKAELKELGFKLHSITGWSDDCYTEGGYSFRTNTSVYRNRRKKTDIVIKKTRTWNGDVWSPLQYDVKTITY